MTLLLHCIIILVSVHIVLLGVLDQKVEERTFQAYMERRVAMLLGEAMGQARRVRRATSIGNSSVQVRPLHMSLMLNTLTACKDNTDFVMFLWKLYTIFIELLVSYITKKNKVGDSEWIIL